jgi:hypothetical protein
MDFQENSQKRVACRYRDARKPKYVATSLSMGVT